VYLETDNSLFKETDPNFDSYKQLGTLTITDKDGKAPAIEDRRSAFEQCFSAKLSDQKFQRLMAMGEYMASDEGSKLLLFGIKGEDWEEKDGKIIGLAKVDAKGNLLHKYLDGGRAWRWPVVFGRYDKELNPNIPRAAKDFVNANFAVYFAQPENLQAFDLDYEKFSAPNKDRFGAFGG
jgi:putative aldouronate transport system substrate-binding protein